MEAAGHSNLQVEFSLTRNEETRWLMLSWLNRRHISDASKDLGFLRNSDTDVEFPLLCCSWAYASASAPFCLCVFLSPLCPAGPYFLFIIILHMFSMSLHFILHITWSNVQTTEAYFPLSKRTLFKYTSFKSNMGENTFSLLFLYFLCQRNTLKNILNPPVVFPSQN